jgi:hypothetical protein
MSRKYKVYKGILAHISIESEITVYFIILNPIPEKFQLGNMSSIGCVALKNSLL